MIIEATGTGAPSVVGRLEREYAEAAQDERAQRIRNLRELAAQGRDTLVVYKGSTKQMVILLLGTVVCAGGAAFYTAIGPRWVQLVYFSCTLLLLVVVISMWLGRNKPFVTLAPQGLVCGDPTHPVPWTAIEDWKVNWMLTQRGRTPFGVTVVLSKDCSLPAIRRFGISYQPKKQQLVLGLADRLRFSSKSGIKVGNIDGFMEHFTTYRRAGLARAELCRMGEDKEG